MFSFIERKANAFSRYLANPAPVNSSQDESPKPTKPTMTAEEWAEARTHKPQQTVGMYRYEGGGAFGAGAMTGRGAQTFGAGGWNGGAGATAGGGVN